MYKKRKQIPQTISTRSPTINPKIYSRDHKTCEKRKYTKRTLKTLTLLIKNNPTNNSNYYLKYTS
jgi:hypothetical protein